MHLNFDCKIIDVSENVCNLFSLLSRPRSYLFW